MVSRQTKAKKYEIITRQLQSRKHSHGYMNPLYLVTKLLVPIVIAKLGLPVHVELKPKSAIVLEDRLYYFLII